MRQGIYHYTVTDDNGWHYTYPSLLAIVLIPFADAPSGTPQPAWAVPYPVSVAPQWRSKPQRALRRAKGRPNVAHRSAPNP